MASHRLLYQRVTDRRPTICMDGDPLPATIAAFPIIVRLLTGRCPLCGRSVSRLSGANDPLPAEYVQ